MGVKALDVEVAQQRENELRRVINEGTDVCGSWRKRDSSFTIDLRRTDITNNAIERLFKIAQP